MLLSVDLDAELGFVAEEIQEVGANWALSPKVKTKPVRTELVPELAFSVTEVLPQFSC